VAVCFAAIDCGRNHLLKGPMASFALFFDFRPVEKQIDRLPIQTLRAFPAHPERFEMFNTFNTRIQTLNPLYVAPNS